MEYKQTRELQPQSASRMVGVRLALVTLLALSCGAELNWWQSEILYQIYPRSFADSDGDGNGDLKGILQHVDYLKEIGIGIVWVSPIYNSPMGDQGYDVSDFRNVNPIFGNLEDAKTLIAAFKNKGIRFLMDFVPNHSSNEHPWFNASRHNDPVYKDFYVWRDPKAFIDGKPVPPNNWVSSFNAIDAWTYDDVRKQYYLHQFAVVQPDLNYRNPKVVDEMYACMKFWLDLGVDGFRMDAVPYLAEDVTFRDEPKRDNCAPPTDCLTHIYTQNVDKTYKVLQDLDNRIRRDFNSTKFMFLEVYADHDQTMKYFYGNSAPFNFRIIQDVNKETKASEMKRLVDRYLQGLPHGAWPNWVTGNHDNHRVGSRLGEDFIDAANMLVLLLPGSSVTFQGEEMGMLDLKLRPEDVIDCCDRDPERTPFQWSNGKNAGFSTGDKTWLPVNPNYNGINVQGETEGTDSHLQIYKRLAALRKELVSSTKISTATIGDVFVVSRYAQEKTYYVLINFNAVEEEVTLSKGFQNAPNPARVVIASVNSAFIPGKEVPTEKLVLPPRSGLVLEV